MTTARKKWTDLAAKASTQPALFEAPEQPRRRRAGTCKKPSIPERDIQRQILDGLLLHPLVARIERINVMAGRLFGKDGKPSRFMRSCAKGRVDLDGFSTSGKVIAIEVKRPTTRNNVTDEQRAYLEQVKRAGGLAGVATCYEEAAAIVEGRGAMARARNIKPGFPKR
ncbi:VRR-NUC domain-containing protein [Accumulibacter sp.]|uniref:VRR-NUC domain-containing protein n=1 Tax=Accumulibacter sp. TaxID=2053492 RepID=UPI002583DF04|nr:VRR-NUC domain-containing protein [Accumulibacter sp.]